MLIYLFSTIRTTGSLISSSPDSVEPLATVVVIATSHFLLHPRPDCVALASQLLDTIYSMVCGVSNSHVYTQTRNSEMIIEAVEMPQGIL